jgi:DNA-directed RNA polymerase subunit RPC12/RpoP
MGRELDCPRCGTRMSFLSRQSVKERSLFFDEWARAINVDWYVCPECDYLELYRARERR